MPHLTSMERLAISDATCEGIHKGIQRMLKVLFGEEGLQPNAGDSQDLPDRIPGGDPENPPGQRKP